MLAESMFPVVRAERPRDTVIHCAMSGEWRLTSMARPLVGTVVGSLVKLSTD